MGQIHNEIAGLYHDPDSEESHHALSVLCTRLMFLMFCEDAGLIEPGLFRDYVASVDGTHLRSALIELFGWLDTDDEARKAEYPSELLARFPYMNGGLFRERIQIPQLNDQVHYEILVSGCQEFDWSGVDPTVFGSIFEGALSHDTRRSGGMHYTSPENIHKVIDPLFLDGLKEELDDILAKQNPSARTRALRAYHDKLGRLTFLDPACGSGNFLTETYVCLRRLENTVLMELQRGGQSEISFEEAEEESPVKVTLANFHGIEVNDFACCVARTALWIAEKQADINTAKVVKRVYDELPLREYGTPSSSTGTRSFRRASATTSWETRRFSGIKRCLRHSTPTWTMFLTSARSMASWTMLRVGTRKQWSTKPMAVCELRLYLRIQSVRESRFPSFGTTSLGSGCASPLHIRALSGIVRLRIKRTFTV